LPLFVARQWIRHRTANVNEYSARYSVLDKEFYTPSLEFMASQSSQNNQGRGDSLDTKDAEKFLKYLKNDALQAYDHYQEMLNLDAEGNPLDPTKDGLARELARMNLPVSFYTQWYWKIDLHNLLHFLSLRADHHAQYEIRVYAEKMLEIVKAWVPLTYEAFMEYKKGATHLSKTATEVLKRKLQGEKITKETSGLGAREWRELLEIFPEIG
jgi:thymidylate synthase (FAD)